MNRLLILVLLIPSMAFAAMTVNHRTGDSGTTGNATPTTSSTGNLSIVAMSLNSGNAGTSVTDNKGSTYSQATTCTGGSTGGLTGSDHWEVWYATNAATGITSVTENWSGGGGGRFEIYDLGGGDTTAPLDVCAVLNNQTTTTNAVGPTVTTSVSGGAVLSFTITGGGVTAISSPFTLDDTPNGYGVASDANSASGSIAPSWTQTNATWGGFTIAFKPPGGVVIQKRKHSGLM